MSASPTAAIAAGQAEGNVIAFDDVTDLVSAQRMAAWGDVARRIAHEIKNPLTPISFRQNAIRRKFRDLAGDEAEALDQLTGVIIRQTGDCGASWTSFSKFARMPEPERSEQDFAALVTDAVTLQEGAVGRAVLTVDLPETPVPVEVDPTLIGQALVNLIKNAGEPLRGLGKGRPEGHEPRVH